MPITKSRTKGWIVVHAMLVGKTSFWFRCDLSYMHTIDTSDPMQMMSALQPDDDGLKFYGQNWMEELKQWGPAGYVWIPEDSLVMASWNFQKEMDDGPPHI